MNDFNTISWEGYLNSLDVDVQDDDDSRTDNDIMSSPRSDFDQSEASGPFGDGQIMTQEMVRDVLHAAREAVHGGTPKNSSPPSMTFLDASSPAVGAPAAERGQTVTSESNGSGEPWPAGENFLDDRMASGRKVEPYTLNSGDSSEVSSEDDVESDDNLETADFCDPADTSNFAYSAVISRNATEEDHNSAGNLSEGLPSEASGSHDVVQNSNLNETSSDIADIIAASIAKAEENFPDDFNTTQLDDGDDDSCLDDISADDSTHVSETPDTAPNGGEDDDADDIADIIAANIAKATEKLSDFVSVDGSDESDDESQDDIAHLVMAEIQGAKAAAGGKGDPTEDDVENDPYGNDNLGRCSDNSFEDAVAVIDSEFIGFDDADSEAPEDDLLDGDSDSEEDLGLDDDSLSDSDDENPDEQARDLQAGEASQYVEQDLQAGYGDMHPTEEDTVDGSTGIPTEAVTMGEPESDKHALVGDGHMTLEMDQNHCETSEKNDNIPGKGGDEGNSTITIKEAQEAPDVVSERESEGCSLGTDTDKDVCPVSEFMYDAVESMTQAKSSDVRLPVSDTVNNADVEDADVPEAADRGGMHLEESSAGGERSEEGSRAAHVQPPAEGGMEPVLSTGHETEMGAMRNLAGESKLISITQTRAGQVENSLGVSRTVPEESIPAVPSSNLRSSVDESEYSIYTEEETFSEDEIDARTEEADETLPVPEKPNEENINTDTSRALPEDVKKDIDGVTLQQVQPPEHFVPPGLNLTAGIDHMAVRHSNMESDDESSSESEYSEYTEETVSDDEYAELDSDQGNGIDAVGSWLKNLKTEAGMGVEQNNSDTEIINEILTIHDDTKENEVGDTKEQGPPKEETNDTNLAGSENQQESLTDKRAALFEDAVAMIANEFDDGGQPGQDIQDHVSEESVDTESLDSTESEEETPSEPDPAAQIMEELTEIVISQKSVDDGDVPLGTMPQTTDAVTSVGADGQSALPTEDVERGGKHYAEQSDEAIVEAVGSRTSPIVHRSNWWNYDKSAQTGKSGTKTFVPLEQPQTESEITESTLPEEQTNHKQVGEGPEEWTPFERDMTEASTGGPQGQPEPETWTSFKTKDTKEDVQDGGWEASTDPDGFLKSTDEGTQVEDAPKMQMISDKLGENSDTGPGMKTWDGIKEEITKGGGGSDGKEESSEVHAWTSAWTEEAQDDDADEVSGEENAAEPKQWWKEDIKEVKNEKVSPEASTTGHWWSDPGAGGKEDEPVQGVRLSEEKKIDDVYESPVPGGMSNLKDPVQEENLQYGQETTSYGGEGKQCTGHEDTMCSQSHASGTQSSINRAVEFSNPYPLPPEQKKHRAPEEILRDHAEEIPKLNVRWGRPSAQLKELIQAAEGSSVARRSNACGALKVLTTSKRKVHHLARTAGLLDALIRASNACQLGDEDEAALDARQRAVTALLNLSELKENRFLIFHHEGFVECIVRVIDEDASEARMLACRLIAILAKTSKNRDSMVANEELISALSRVIRGKCNSAGIISSSSADMMDPQTAEEKFSGSLAEDQISSADDSRSALSSINQSEDVSEFASRKQKKKQQVRKKQGAPNVGSIRQQNDERFDEYLNISRLSACAALSHLAKHCTAAAKLCKHDEFLKHILVVCLEFDHTIHTRCLEILCHLTRFPANNIMLSKNPEVVSTLLAGGKSKSAEDRAWATRTFQNLTSDPSSRILLATGPILTLLTVSAMRKELDEQRAAVAALYNLSTEPGAIVPLTNTKNVVATLVHIAHNTDSSSDVCRMACDALATIGLWLQTLAGAGTVPITVEKVPLPSHTSSGWMRWE